MKRQGGFTAEIGNRTLDDTESLFEMANLFSKHTGLPFVFWIFYRGSAQHDVRVKVSPGPKVLPSQMASVAIRPTVRVLEGEMSGSDLNLLTKWIELNRDVLVRYWDGEIDTKDALDLMQALR